MPIKGPRMCFHRRWVALRIVAASAALSAVVAVSAPVATPEAMAVARSASTTSSAVIATCEPETEGEAAQVDIPIPQNNSPDAGYWTGMVNGEGGSYNTDQTSTDSSTFSVLNNVDWHGADHGAWTPVLYQKASNGTVVMNSNGTFTYTPKAGYFGSDSFYFVVQITLTGECSSSAEVTIPSAADTIYTSNGPVQVGQPIIASDPSCLCFESYTAHTDGRLSLAAPGVLAGMSDPLGYQLVASLAQPLIFGGQATQNPDGSMAVQNLAAGTTEYQLRVCRQPTINPVKYLPPPGCVLFLDTIVSWTEVIPSNDVYTTPYATTLDVSNPSAGVAANDLGNLDNSPIRPAPLYPGYPGDCNGGCQTWLTGVTVTTQPQHGSVSMNGNGTFTYVPNAGSSGTDTFQYTDQTNNGTSPVDPATVTIHVLPSGPPAPPQPTITMTASATPTSGTQSAPVYNLQDVGDDQSLVVTITPASSNATDPATISGCTDNGTVITGWPTHSSEVFSDPFVADAAYVLGGGSQPLANPPSGFTSLELGLGVGSHDISCTANDSNGPTGTETNTVTVAQTFVIDIPTVTITPSTASTGGTAETWYNAQDLGGQFSPPNTHALGVSVTAAPALSVFPITSLTCSNQYDQSWTSSPSTPASLTLPAQGDGVNNIQCTATDSEGDLSLPTNGNFQIDTYAPSQQFELPLGIEATGGSPQDPWFNAADLGGAANLTVLISACDDCTSVGGSNLYLTNAVSGLAGQSCTVNGGPAITSTNSPMELELGNGVDTVTCTSADVAGNVSPPITRTFQVDDTLPTMTSLKDGPDTGAPFTVTFSEPVALASAYSFAVYELNYETSVPVNPLCASTPVAGRCSTWKLVHTTPLVPGFEYEVFVGGNGEPITDSVGNAVTTAGIVAAPTKLLATDPAIQEQWATVSDTNSFYGYYSEASMPGATYSYTFTGTSVTWYTHQGPDQGIAGVSITNPAGKAVNTTVDDYAASPGDQVPFTYSGLTNRTHTITIKALYQNNSSSSGYYVSVEGFSIGGAVQTRAYGQQWATINLGAPANTFAYSVEPGSEIDVSFYGTGATAVLRQGPINGIADVAVDGTPTKTIDTYKSSFGWSKPLTLASGLSSGLHTVTISIDTAKNPLSSGNQIAFDKVAFQ